jgi:hypothetical protein
MVWKREREKCVFITHILAWHLQLRLLHTQRLAYSLLMVPVNKVYHYTVYLNSRILATIITKEWSKKAMDATSPLPWIPCVYKVILDFPPILVIWMSGEHIKCLSLETCCERIPTRLVNKITTTVGLKHSLFFSFITQRLIFNKKKRETEYSFSYCLLCLFLYSFFSFYSFFFACVTSNFFLFYIYLSLFLSLSCLFSLFS